MQLGVAQVTTTPVQIPLVMPYNFLQGMRLLARVANSDNVFVGLSQSVTATTGNLVSQGAPASSIPFTVSADTLNLIKGGIWLVAASGTQVVDWSAA